MKKVRGIVIVLLFVMVAGCSNIKSEQQEDNGIAIEQQTEEENQTSTMEYSGVNYPIDAWNSNLTLKEVF